MSALLDNGLDVTALHNHFFFDEPRMLYMHVHGHGKPADLARKVKPALDLIGKGTSRPATTPAAPATSTPQIDTAKLATGFKAAVSELGKTKTGSGTKQ